MSTRRLLNRTLRRLAVPVVGTFAGTLVPVLALLAGQHIQPRMIVSPQGVIRDEIIYDVTDMTRRVTAGTTVNAPDVIDATWVSEPPLILQRTRDSRAAAYTLSELSPQSGRLTTLVNLSTPPNIPLIALSFVLRRTPEGTQAAAYLVTGEIWITDIGDPGARLLATVERNLEFPLQWSPDGATISVKDNTDPALTLVTVSDGTVRRVDAPRDSWPVWSPDSRYILLNTPEIISMNAPIRVIDVAAGEVAPLTGQLSGRLARWCGSGTFMYAYQIPVSFSEVRLTDVLRNQTETVMPTDALLGQVVTSTAPVKGHGCDFMLVSTLHLSKAGARLYLLNRATGDVQLLGLDSQVVEVRADVLIYDTLIAGVRTRKTVRLPAGGL